MPSIEVLYLYNNSFTGSLDANNLPHTLKELKLSNNTLGNEIPTKLGEFENLEVLSLNGECGLHKMFIQLVQFSLKAFFSCTQCTSMQVMNLSGKSHLNLVTSSHYSKLFLCLMNVTNIQEDQFPCLFTSLFVIPELFICNIISYPRPFLRDFKN